MAEKNSKADEEAQSNFGETSERQKLIEAGAAFDVKKDCVFCAKEADLSLNSSGKYVVWEIWHQNVLDKVKEIVNKISNSDNYDLIKARINAILPITDKSIFPRYHTSCWEAAKDKKRKSESELREEQDFVRFPMDEEVLYFMDFLFNYIAQSSEGRHKFSVVHITSLYREENPHRALPARKEIKCHLDCFFKKEIVYQEVKKDLVFCIKEDAMLSMRLKYWEKEGMDSMTEKEKKKVLKKSASILLKEINAANFDTESPGGCEIPPKLYQFLDKVTEGCEEEEEDETVRAERLKYLSHCIIAAVRPDSFSSPILTGLTETLREEGCPKPIIGMLASLGLVAPLDEARTTQSSEDDGSDIEESSNKNTNHTERKAESERFEGFFNGFQKNQSISSQFNTSSNNVVNIDETGLYSDHEKKTEKRR